MWLGGVEGFDSVSGYQRLQSQLDRLERTGAAMRTSIPTGQGWGTAWQESWYQCKGTGEVWRLVGPDPPFRGIFKPVASSAMAEPIAISKTLVARPTVRVWATDMRSGRLPEVSPLSGARATTSRRFRYSTGPKLTPIWIVLFAAGLAIGIGWIPVVLIWLATSKRASGSIHLTPEEIIRIRNGRLRAAGLLLLALALIYLAIVLPEALAGLLVVLALLALIAAIWSETARPAVRARVTEPVAGKLAVEILDAHPSFAKAVTAMYGPAPERRELPCCGPVDVRRIRDLPHVYGFDFDLFQCVSCNRYWVAAFGVTSISSWEPISAKEAETMEHLQGDPLRKFMKEWGSRFD